MLKQVVSTILSEDDTYEPGLPNAVETLVGVRIKRPRGRPKKLLPRDFRREPTFQVLPDRFTCIACSTKEDNPSPTLPIFCDSCISRFVLEGMTDPTEDLQTVHYLWYGPHLEGISDEAAERPTSVSKAYRLEYIKQQPSRFQLMAYHAGAWKMVPAKCRRPQLICDYHETLGHRHGAAIY